MLFDDRVDDLTWTPLFMDIFISAQCSIPADQQPRCRIEPIRAARPGRYLTNIVKESAAGWILEIINGGK